MEINPNRNVDPLTPVNGPVRAKAPAQTQAEATSFEQSESLNYAMATTPNSRADVVRRAEALVSSSAYPPREVIQRIANLLAANL